MYSRAKETVQWTVEIPFNTRAKIYVATRRASTASIDDPSLKLQKESEDLYFYDVGSGKYTLNFAPDETEKIIFPFAPKPLAIDTSLTGKYILTLSNTFGKGNIYYTTDLSEPTMQSKLYKGPILITTTSVIKARCIVSEAV